MESAMDQRDNALAMSQENVELMAAVIDGLNARDFDAVDESFNDRAEWRPALTAGGAVEGAVYRGRAGMRRYMQDIDSEFDELRFNVQRIDAVGGARVLYRGRVQARGRASGIRLDVPIWGLWTISGRKLTSGVGFLSEREALDAAGLSD